MLFSRPATYPETDRKEAPTLDQKKTGQFLKTLRNEKGLTQEQLAKHFNVSNRSVSRWETGSNLPDISLLVEIADFYDVDVREIIDGERKSEMMDNETREVAGKMAAYAGNEKGALLKFVQIAGIAGIFTSLLSLILQTISYQPDLRRSGAIMATFLAFIVMCVITLYVTGILQKLSKRKKLVKTVKILTIVAMAAGTYYVVTCLLAVALFGAVVTSAKKHVTNDPAEYNNYIHNDKGADSEFSMGNHAIFNVMPGKITAEVKEFSLFYYNPWDPQYIIYMTLDYKEGYDAEISRLKKIGVEDYKGIYMVTDEPAGYDLIAMDSDSHDGFVYAMIPEGSSDNTKITYVAVVFCNYALDVDVHKYMKDEYLLKGFDATDDSPYRKKMLSGI